MLPKDPVHWLENVDGDPHHVRTICRHFSWRSKKPKLLDPARAAIQTVTCPECLVKLREMQPDEPDEPVIVVK